MMSSYLCCCISLRLGTTAMMWPGSTMHLDDAAHTSNIGETAGVGAMCRSQSYAKLGRPWAKPTFSSSVLVDWSQNSHGTLSKVSELESTWHDCMNVMVCSWHGRMVSWCGPAHLNSSSMSLSAFSNSLSTNLLHSRSRLLPLPRPCTPVAMAATAVVGPCQSLHN